MTYRLFENFAGGTLDVALADVDTTLDSSELAGVMDVVAGEELLVTLDPEASTGAPEIVRITAHGVGATTATIERGVENTVARAHAIGTLWEHAAVATDYSRAPRVPIREEAGTAYTVTEADHGFVLVFSNAALVTVDLPDGIDVGFLCHLLFTGAGGGTIQDNGTSTVNGAGNVLTGAEASALVYAADTWNVQGAA